MRKPRFDPETTLVAFWSDRERDLMYAYPQRADGRLLHLWFGLALGLPGQPQTAIIEELERRGYDPATLRFSIQLKEKPREPHATAVEACPHGCVGVCSLCARPPGSESSAPSAAREGVSR